MMVSSLSCCCGYHNLAGIRILLPRFAYSKVLKLNNTQDRIKQFGLLNAKTMSTNVLTESPHHRLPTPEKLCLGTSILSNAKRSLFGCASETNESTKNWDTLNDESSRKRNCSSNQSSPNKITDPNLAGILKKEPSIKKKPFIVSIEGNIGSGKSTFLKYFSKFPNVMTHQEPIDLWTNCGGYNLLGKLYEDPKRYSFLFQSYVQLTRLNIHLQETDCAVKLIERSLHNNRYCFVEQGHDSGMLHDAEFNVLSEYFDFLESNLDLSVDLIVYLRTTPEIVHERMKKRGREEESEVPLDYLKRIHDYYEKWLLKKMPCNPPAPVLIIDADLDMDRMMKDYESNKLMILGQQPYIQNIKDALAKDDLTL